MSASIYDTDPQLRDLRDASGRFESDDRLVLVFYLLLRDHITAGQMEQVMEEVLQAEMPEQFTNGWLAKYALYTARRIQSRQVADYPASDEARI